MASITRYVNAAADAGGNGTTPALTSGDGTHAYKLPSSAVDDIQTNGDGTSTNYIYIAAGAYTNVLDFDHANHDNLIVTGSGRGLTTITASAGSHGLYLRTNVDVIVNDLLLTTTNTDKYAAYADNTTGSLTFNDCDFTQPSGASDNRIRNVGSVVNLNNCRIYHGAGVAARVSYEGDASGDINNCILIASPLYKTTVSLSLNTSGTVNINNSLILDASGHGVHALGTGVTNITNCIISCGAANNDTYCVLKAGTNTVTISNSHLIANTYDGETKWTSGTIIDGGGNTHLGGDVALINKHIAFKTYPRRGYIIPCIDDTISFAYAQAVAEKLNDYNMKGTYFINQVGWNTANNAALRTMVSDGVMEVACHSYSHSNLSITGKIWDVVKGVETITIDRSAATITLSGGGSVTGFKAKTLAAIKLELEGLGATVTPTAIYGADTTDIHTDALGEVIDDGAAVNVVNILIDNTGAGGYFKAEITDPKAWLTDTIVNGAGPVVDGQTHLDYVCNTFGFPYNASTADARLACISLGFTAARSTKIGGAGTAADAMFLTDVDLYQTWIWGSLSYLKGDGSETAIRYNARAIGFAVAHTGLCLSILAHYDGATEELTPVQWEYALDEWSKFGDAVNVTSLQLFATAIQSRLTDDGDGTYSATGANAFTVNDGDYHLTVATPQEIRNGGKDVSLTTDFEGNVVPFGGGFPIGPYRGPAMGGGLSLGLGVGGGGQMPPWRRRRR